jgi:hypothetical protein
MIRFQGQFTRETLLRATRLTMNRFRFLLWFFGVMVVLTFFGSVIVPLRHGAPFDPVALLPPLVFATLLGILVWSPYATVDRSLKTNKLIQEPLEGHADETGVYFSTAHSRSDLPWDMFHKAVFSDSMVLLGQSAQQFYPFPREFFASDEDWTAFLALVREKAPQAKEGRLLLKMFVIWTVIFIVVILLWTAFQANR